MFRNDGVYEIRIGWIKTSDDRFTHYSYGKMYYPSKSNWYGLRYPKDRHYKMIEQPVEQPVKIISNYIDTYKIYYLQKINDYKTKGYETL